MAIGDPLKSPMYVPFTFSGEMGKVTSVFPFTTGGASSAVAYVLDKLHIDYRYVSRHRNEDLQILGYADLDKNIMSLYPLIINCTPVGTYPNVEEAPEIPYQLVTDQLYLFDLVYNPAKTKFLAKGEAQGAAIQNGYDMLILQAEENWKLWNEEG